jgi:ER lumen protein retaining receptor
MMNLFRLLGDMFHVTSIVVLLLRLKAMRNANGISIKTQELYLLVFVTRYLDLFTTFYSWYNSLMKVLYISVTAYIIYMVRKTEPFKKEYEADTRDGFLHLQYAVAPCVILALVTNLIQGFNVIEMLWTFSIYLEAIAIVPQLIVLQRWREVENLTGHYVFLLGAYRALYILNWVYRSYYEPYYKHNWVVYGCGIVQTCLYVDFFYYYFLSKYRGQKLHLPN